MAAMEDNGKEVSIKPVCDDQCCFRDTAKPVFTPDDHSRQRTRMAESRMGEEEA